MVEDWVALGSCDKMGGSGEDEVLADTVETTVNVGRVTVDEIEETGAIEESPTFG